MAIEALKGIFRAYAIKKEREVNLPSQGRKKQKNEKDTKDKKKSGVDIKV